MSIEVSHLSKQFGASRVLDDVSLRVERGELVALLGPSGSGKTTLLRVIAGLEAPDQGRVWFDGEDATAASARDRRVGFVFQHYALFRHMTVFENVAFGLRVQSRRQRMPEDALVKRVTELLELVQIEKLAQRHPSQLSGGQRQRVALARALAVQPRVLLLDEPFGALDARVRKELRRWLRRIHEEVQLTSVFVTHDQEEALELADRVALMDRGRIEQVGTPEDVYARPASPFVLDFLGEVNLFRCRVEAGNVYVGDRPLDLRVEDGAASGVGTLYARPHVFTIEEDAALPGTLPARILEVNPAGPVVKLELVTTSGDLARVDVPRDEFEARRFARGANVFLRARSQDFFVVGVGGGVAATVAAHGGPAGMDLEADHLGGA